MRRSGCAPARAAALALLVPFLLLFTACRQGESWKKPAAARLAGGFTCTADAMWSGTHYQVQITRLPSGAFTLVFLQPANLKSLSFEAGSGEVRVRFGKLSLAVDPESIPQTALYRSLQQVFAQATSPDSVRAAVQSGKKVLTGKTAAGDFALTLGEGYVPVSLELPAQKLSLSFSGFTFSS
jgi:hypothetical protein